MEINEKRQVPKVVALVAMGGSRQSYIGDVMRAGGPKGVADEIWVVNKLGAVLEHDLVFRMDDLRKPRDCNLKQGTNRCADDTIHDTQTEWMKTHPKPIVTSTKYPEFPTSLEYPLEEVVNTIGYSYFLTTPAYAAAFAIHIGVEHLKLYGCDYVYPDNVYIGESGRANLEFILAVGMMKGMRVEVANTSTLLGSNLAQGEWFYGYEHIIECVQDNGKDPKKRYVLKHRHDLTKKRDLDIKEREKKQWQHLTSKNIAEIKRDLIRGKWITHEDIDEIMKEEVSDEAENDNGKTSTS